MTPRIPIVLVTGFLGAGKTTFINWLLETNPTLNISVILNEFGDTALESQFLSRQADGVVELKNGCMCCVAKSDIPRVIDYILEHSPQTEYLVIEASGLSDPDPVREALQTPPVNEKVYLEHTVCVVDAANFQSLRGEHSIITSQIADADLVVLNKQNLAGSALTEQVTTALTSLTPEVRVLMFDDQLVSEIFLTSTNALNRPTLEPHSHEHVHQPYQTYVYTPSQPMAFLKLRSYISQLPPAIIRIKGVVECRLPAGELARVKIQRVGAHVTVDEADDRTTESTKTSVGSPPNVILFIGTTVNDAQLKSDLEQLL